MNHYNNSSVLLLGDVSEPLQMVFELLSYRVKEVGRYNKYLVVCLVVRGFKSTCRKTI